MKYPVLYIIFQVYKISIFNVNFEIYVNSILILFFKVKLILPANAIGSKFYYEKNKVQMKKPLTFYILTHKFLVTQFYTF